MVRRGHSRDVDGRDAVAPDPEAHGRVGRGVDELDGGGGSEAEEPDGVDERRREGHEEEQQESAEGEERREEYEQHRSTLALRERGPQEAAGHSTRSWDNRYMERVVRTVRKEQDVRFRGRV